MSDEEDRAWAEQHQAVISEAFRRYLDTGEWPKVIDLRRFFAQRSQVLDIAGVVNSRPRFPGELRPFHQETLVLRLRQLRYVPIALPLLQVCMAATRRAVQVYLTEGAEPKVSSADPQIAGMAGNNQELLMRAGPFLSSDQPSPLGGGSWGTDAWEYFVNDYTIMDFQNIGTLDEFVRRQEQIVERESSPALVLGGMAVSPSTQPINTPALRDDTKRVFVLMPFGQDWSRGVYELIHRAANALDCTPPVTVLRADDIVRPGLITDQIIAEIEAADAVVADITGLNPNVMWELGYAHALGKPVVILNQDVHNSPFDIRNHRQVIYNNLATAEDQEMITRSMRSALDL